MVKIRLTRGGARKHAYYRVVAMDSRRQRDGRALEFLGSYDPLCDPVAIKLDDARIAHWLAQGAELSKAVKGLMRRARKLAGGGGGARRRRSRRG